MTLNCALAAHIITDFVGDEKGVDIIPTVSGRMSSGNFKFSIRDKSNGGLLEIGVQNSQIEIDAAYEGLNYLCLLEAKIDIPEDFIVRQLYYPYRTWANRVTKTVKPIFLIYSNGIYHLYEYKFGNINDYSSIELVKQKNYSIENTEINIDDIYEVIKNIKLEDEPRGVPFPQADSFERLINMCELIKNENHKYNRDKITQNYNFTPRQTD